MRKTLKSYDDHSCNVKNSSLGRRNGVCCFTLRINLQGRLILLKQWLLACSLFHHIIHPRSITCAHINDSGILYPKSHNDYVSTPITFPSNRSINAKVKMVLAKYQELVFTSFITQSDMCLMDERLDKAIFKKTFHPWIACCDVWALLRYRWYLCLNNFPNRSWAVGGVDSGTKIDGRVLTKVSLGRE